jgi:hypothetical protein
MSDVVGLAQPDKAYPRTPEWAEMERLNGERMLEFQRQLAMRNGGGMPYAVPAEQGDNITMIEPAGDPHEALAEAKLAHASAREAVGKVRSGRDRARDRLDAHERDAARFAGLDDRIRRTLIERSYSDSPDDGLPIADQVALDERARLIERTSQATRAVGLMDEELRLVEQQERETDRAVRSAATAVLMSRVPALVERAAALEAELHEVLQDIKSLADCSLPTMTGGAQLPPAAVAALNAVRPELQRDLQRELSLREEHSRLMDD